MVNLYNVIFAGSEQELDAAKGFTLGTSYCWSSSQYDSYNNDAYQVDFSDGYVYGSYNKYYVSYVFVLQAFNAEQFN